MIAAIVVLYNPTLDEIKHITDYYSLVDETIVLDNSNEDQFVRIEKVIGDSKHLIYKWFGENVGLCVALNEGMRIAKERGHKWSLLMDSDSSFITDIISVYKSFLSKNIDNDIAVLSPVHIHDRSYEREFSGTKLVKWAMTSGCLYNIDIFNKIGRFKEELFVDGLDIDYCYKARKNGYKVIEIADAKLQHYPGKTQSVYLFGKKINYGIASPDRYYMQSRAIVWLILKYHCINDIIRYMSKWGKVILLFKDKKNYMTCMLKGSKQGFLLWKNSMKCEK